MGLCCISPIEGVGQLNSFPTTEAISRSHTRIQTDRQNHHTMQEGMIQYVTTQILHTVTIAESYHNIRALPAFKLAAFSKKGKEIASCERDICHWPSEAGECSL